MLPTVMRPSTYRGIITRPNVYRNTTTPCHSQLTSYLYPSVGHQKSYQPGTFSRRLSTSATSFISLSDFFRTPLTPAQTRQAGVQNAYQNWLRALDRQEANSVKSSFGSLLRWVGELRRHGVVEALDLPKPAEIRKAMEIISQTASTADVDLLKSMVSDYSKMSPSEEWNPHEVLLQGMVNAGVPAEALSWLGTLPPDVEVSEEICQELMMGFGRSRNREGLKATLELLRRTQKPLSSGVYAAYLQGIFNDPASGAVEDVDIILQQMKLEGLEKDWRIYETLIGGFSDNGKSKEAAEFAREAEEYAKENNLSPAEPTYHAFWNVLILHQTSAHSSKSGRELVNKLRLSGFQPSTATLNVYLQGIKRATLVSEMLGVAQDWEVLPNEETWEVLISAALEDGGLSKAFEIYEESRSFTQPTPKMVDRLIAELCSSTAGKMLPDHFQAAMEIYTTMHEHFIPTISNHQMYHSHIINIYYNLLCGSSGDSNETVLALLANMKEKSLFFDTRMATAITTRLMRQAPSHSIAYKIYTRVRELNNSTFDAESFTSVLSTFASLSFRPPGRRFPPQDIYFRIVADMSEAGYPPNQEHYTRLFHRYRSAIINLQDAHRAEFGDPNMLLKRDFRQAHTLLRLDPLITPELDLLNIIMDAYGRFGDMATAYEIWTEQLCSPPIYDPKSVSIIIDTIGYYANRQLAMHVWSTIRAREDQDPGFELNVNCWRSWVECLCRLGCHEDARRVVLNELGSPESRGPMPSSPSPYDKRPHADRWMVKLLKDFTPKSSRASLNQLVREYLPHLSDERV